MLGLLHETDPRWVEAFQNDGRQLDVLLSDHAHCEVKAAQNALALIARFGGEAPEIVPPLLALVREEATHFEQVGERLAIRGVPLGMPGADPYVVALQAAVKSDRADVPVLLDRLLVAALIEARSCERFRLLAEGLADGTLRAFYRELMASEARHHQLFVALAEGRFGAHDARVRLAQLAEREAAISRKLPLGPTVHG